MLKEHISFINYRPTPLKGCKIKIKIKETVQLNKYIKELSHDKNLFMLNSKGDNFKENHFQTSFARIRCINLSHFSGLLLSFDNKDLTAKQNYFLHMRKAK